MKQYFFIITAIVSAFSTQIFSGTNDELIELRNGEQVPQYCKKAILRLWNDIKKSQFFGIRYQIYNDVLAFYQGIRTNESKLCDAYLQNLVHAGEMQHKDDISFDSWQIIVNAMMAKNKITKKPIFRKPI